MIVLLAITTYITLTVIHSSVCELDMTIKFNSKSTTEIIEKTEIE